MSVLIGLNIMLHIMLFTIAAVSGFLVRLDRWVDGDEPHPTKLDGSTDYLKTFFMYVLTFLISGAAGSTAAILFAQFSSKHDIEIMFFIAMTVGAIGRIFFYHAIDWIHKKGILIALGQDHQSTKAKKRN